MTHAQALEALHTAGIPTRDLTPTEAIQLAEDCGLDCTSGK